MKLYGVTPDQLMDLVRAVSDKCFDGNVILRECEARGVTKPYVHFTLRVEDSRGPGAKISIRMGRERHLPAACYHAHWAIMWAIFQVYPMAQLHTMWARYTAPDFKEKAFKVGRVNIGSRAFPVQFIESCDCEADSLGVGHLQYALSSIS
jgi:hypothetical protein